MPKLEVRLERSAYAPGETVRGWVRAVEGGRSRAGMAQLRYLERTDDYTEVAWQKMERLWDGELQDGARFEFAIDLPADAKPGYSSANGSLAWEAFVRSDEFGQDTTVAQPFELTPPADGYPVPASVPAPRHSPTWVKRMAVAGPAVGAGVGYTLARVPGAVGGVAVMSASSAWGWRRRAKHFAVEPPAPVRRGERARVTVRMIDASRVEGELEAEIECLERYDYRSSSGKSTTRETKDETLHVERVPLGMAQRSVDIEVPAEMPFSHGGNCLSYVWKAIVRERRDNGVDRLAEAPLLVMP